MYRILLATDGSDYFSKVVEEALLIAEALKAEVTVLTVVGEYVFTPRVSVHFAVDSWDLIHRHFKEEAEEIVEKAAQPFKDKGIKVKKEVVVGPQSPADVICEMAASGDYNLVILGSRGLKGVKGAFLGSVSSKVVHCAGNNVLIIK